MISGRSAMRLTISGLQHAAGRDAKENVGAIDDLAERPRLGVLGVDLLPAIHQRCCGPR